MAKDRIGGAGSGPQFIPETTTEQTTRSNEVRKTRERVELNLADIPEKSDLGSKPSPLAGVIAQGLAKLADAKEWTSTAKSLDVLVSAMGAGASRVNQAAADEAVAHLQSKFGRLLRGMVAVTPETIQSIKQDAPKLVELAVVALGSAGVDGKKNAQQLVTDLEVVRGALEDIIKMPPDERASFLKKQVEDFSWVAGVFDRAGAALQSAQVEARTRYDALIGIFSIVSKYANADAS